MPTDKPVAPRYTVVLNDKRLNGCRMNRAFPWEVHDDQGNVVQFAKTKAGAYLWIENHG